MKKILSLAAAVAVIGLLCTVGLFSTSVLAQVVDVDAKATGEFGGHPDVSVPIVLDMVPGFVFSGPGAIRITASGTIDLTPNLSFPVGQNVPPDGQGLLNRLILGAADRYLPLEEALVDASGTGALPPNISGGGALMGAFVPQAIVNAPGFLAKDDDFPNGGISSDSLFFIGSGPFDFTATIPGTLFLGINDVRANNNSGSFEVTINIIASIDPSVTLGAGSTVGAGSVLKKNITIGADANIGENVTLNQDIVAGDGFEVGDGTIVNQGTDFGDDVVVGQNVTIGRFCWIGSHVDIGDNTTIGQRCDIGDDVLIGSNVVMGRDVTVASGQVIPNDSVIPGDATIP